MDEGKIQMVGDRVMVRREKTATRAGLHVPETSQFQCFGRIVGVGESFGLDRDGNRKPALEGILGKRVLFDPAACWDWPGDSSLVVMHSSALWAIVEAEPNYGLVAVN